MRYLILSLSTLLSLVLIYSCGTESTPVYTLTTSVIGEGAISPFSGEYEEGEIVTLTGTPSNGWRFVRWEGDWNGESNPVNLGMTKNYNIVGIFQRSDYPLTITIEGEGDVEQEIISSPKSTEYPFETVVQLTAKPNDGWVFYQWNGDLSGDNNPETIEIDEGKNVTSVFKSIDELLTIVVTGEGTVDIQQEAFEDNVSRRNVTLTPIPSEGWVFIKWDGDIQSDNELIDLTVTTEINLVATFATRPTIETICCTFPTDNSAVAGGIIKSNGNNQITKSGLCWSKNMDSVLNPSLDNCINADIEQDSFNIELANLDFGTAYYVKAFASNSIGNSFGELKSFSTAFPHLQLWSGNNKSSLPYFNSGTITRSSWPNPPSVWEIFTFRLIAVGESFTITNVSAVDRNNLVSASFSGLSNGTTITPGEEITFTLLAGRTFGRQTDILYRFDVADQNTPFSFRVIFTSN